MVRNKAPQMADTSKTRLLDALPPIPAGKTGADRRADRLG